MPDLNDGMLIHLDVFLLAGKELLVPMLVLVTVEPSH